MYMYSHQFNCRKAVATTPRYDSDTTACLLQVFYDCPRSSSYRRKELALVRIAPVTTA